MIICYLTFFEQQVLFHVNTTMRISTTHSLDVYKCLLVYPHVVSAFAMDRTFQTEYQPLNSLVNENNDEDQEVPPSNNITQIVPDYGCG